MSAERNRETAVRVYEAFNQRDFGTMRDCLAGDAVVHAVPAELGLGQDPDAFIEVARMYVEAFPDIRMDVLEAVADGDRVAARVRAAGTHEGEFVGIPASGRRIELETLEFARFNTSGECVERRAYEDNLVLMQQIGAVPDEPAG